MTVYQHPSAVALYQTASSSSKPEGSSTTLLLDHLLYLQANSRILLGRRELGMGPPCPFAQGEWATSGDGESEDEEIERVLGYGSGRRGKGEGRVKPRREGGGGHDNDGREDEEETKKVEGTERVLAALLSKLKMNEEESDEEESDEEAEGEVELNSDPSSAMNIDDPQPSSSSTSTTSNAGPSSSPTSSCNTSDIFVPPLLPPSTQLRLLISGGLDLLLSPSLSPPPTHLPPPSAYNPTLPQSLLKVNSILAPISSSPIPQLVNSSTQPPGSATASSIASVHPLLNHSRGGEAPKYPRGSIWDQVPRAAGPEGPWAFAGGQSQASRALGGSSSGSVATMPSFPSSSHHNNHNGEVEGPRTKKAVGRAKVLFDAGIQSESPTSFHQPRSRPPLSTSSSSSSTATRGVASGLEPPCRKWWDVVDSSDPQLGGLSVDGEGLGRMMGFLRLFLQTSRVATEGVGKGMVDRVESRRGRSLVRHLFGGLGGEGPDGVWTSDSEGSVCGSDDEDVKPSASAASTSNTIGSSSSSIPTSSATFTSPSSSHHHPLPVRNPTYLYPSSQPPSRSPSPTPIPTPSRRGASSRLTTRQHLARPSRAWYALLSALLTQVCIEGFGEFGWKGGEAVELVLGVGRGGVRRKGGRGGAGAGAGGVVGGLEDAGWELFGGRGDGGKRRTEFEKEMEERCEEFLTVDSHTRTLRDHFASLAAKYPLEPVERAALRFIESIASFVGVPDLAQPLPMPPPSYTLNQVSSSSSIPISSLLNPHPLSNSTTSAHHHIPFPTYQQQPPTPPSNPRAILRRKGVERFFVPPRMGHKKVAKKVERGTKRGRGEDGSVGGGEAKERRLEDGGEDEEMESENEAGAGVVVEDWPDPYGVQAMRR
ncbi:hypothetical protein BDY24DRAFT_368212 [Mrakia frigida]|uniref:uncharacterized protein n=1 Tax=Mrakia frigida TaxID=29902 RepID=UPI003FCC168D